MDDWKARKERSGKLREPKTCRIFFSSPFGGMEEEREELTRKYFPQIHHACNAKGVQFVAVDMRWGITSQAAENAQVINICLREIDRSDIFVGFFGQRYGWHGADDRSLQDNFDNAVLTYPWLDDVRDRSVTELEFLHGHLNNPGHLPACMCFRDKAYDNKQHDEGLSKGDKKQVFKYTSESDHATAMMDDLKGRVKDTESKCLGVNMSYCHPHEGARFMFESIWPYLTEVLLANTHSVAVSKRDELLEEHDAFRARHVSVYDGGRAYLDFLNSKIEEEQSGVLVLGPAGSGKSALLSNWTTQLQASRPDLLVIYHFMGCAPGTTVDRNILFRLLLEVRHALNKDKEPHGEENSTTVTATVGDAPKESDDVQTLQTGLVRGLEELVRKEGRRVVLVLDGLDRAPSQGKTTKHLYWLPKAWPAGALFVGSTVDTDSATYDLLVTERKYQTLTVVPLDGDTKREICVQVLKKSGKELSAEQLDRVVSAHQTSSPLYLRLVLNELSIFGYFRLLDKKIDSLIYNSDVGELLQKMFARLEEDYNGKDRNSAMVQEVLCAIELSTQGLLEKELMEMLNIESHDWLPLYFALEGLLISHAGLLRFGFAEISQAVRTKYLQNEEEIKRIQKMLIGYFDKKLQSIPVGVDLLTPLSKRPVEELPWLQLAVGDVEGLSSTLLNMYTLHYMQTHSKYEFFELWKATGKKMSEVCDLYLKMFDLAIADLYLYQNDLTLDGKAPPGFKLRPLLSSMANLFDMAEFPQGCVKIHQRDVDVLLHIRGTIPSDERFLSMTESCYKLACSLVDCGELQKGEDSHRQVLESCQEFLADYPDNERMRQTLGNIYNGIGVVCVKQRRWTDAIGMFEDSLKLHIQLGDKSDVASCYVNLGMCHMENGDPQGGLDTMLKALEMYEELYFGHLPLETGNLLTNVGLCYRRLGDLDKAEETYMRSLQLKANAVGWDHDVVAVAYMNLCTLNLHRSDFDKAEQFVRKAVRIMEDNGATLDKVEYRQAVENLICSLLSNSKTEEALPLYLPLFDKLVALGAMDRCVPSAHREMARYLLHIGHADKAREVTVALIDSHCRDVTNFIMLDHLQSLLPEGQRPVLPDRYTLDYALKNIWPGNPDLTRRLIEYHALPANDLDLIVRLQKLCAEQNRQWGAYSYQACAQWCLDTNDNKEAAVRVLEAGVEDYPQELDLRLQLMDLCRQMGQPARAYPHLPLIMEQRKDDPAAMIIAGNVAVHSNDIQMALQCFDIVCTLDNPDLAEKAKAAAKTLRDHLAESGGGDGCGEENDDNRNDANSDGAGKESQ